MNTLARIKLALAVMGLIIWAWGARMDDSFLRVAGIVVLLIAFLLRFLGRSKRPPPSRTDEPPAP